MRDREVTFDGKNLSFYIDNVQIVNGEMPDSYEINGKYTIDRESLIRLVSALKKDVYGVVIQKTFRAPMWAISHHMTIGYIPKMTFRKE